MKKYLIIFMLLLACSKEKIKTKDILQTDVSGNIKGGNSSEWNIQLMGSEFDDIKIQFEEQILGDSIINYPFTTFNYDCPIPTVLQIYAFPNPINNIENLKIRVHSSTPICAYNVGYEGLVGRFPGAGSFSGGFVENSISYCLNDFDFPISGHALSSSFPTDDFKLSYLVITEGGCVFYAEGKIKVE